MAEEEKKNTRTMQRVKEWKSLFRSFFARYSVFGISLLVIAYLLRFEVCPLLTKWPKLAFICDLAHFLCGTTGVALIVASVFSFSIESASFLGYMKRILVKIVVSKDFLRNLTLANKKEALELILKPSEDQIKLYSNVEEYFHEYIEKSMHLFEHNFKSKGVINLFATYSDDDPTLRIEETVSHTVYRTETQFNNLEFGFEDERSNVLGGEITPPNKPHIVLNANDFKKSIKREESGFVWTEYKYDIPDDLHYHPYLAFQLRLIEYGHDHWQIFTLKTIGFFDGLATYLRCDRDLIVKDYMIYDLERNYSIRLSEDRKMLHINCSQWVEPGRGFSILVAKNSATAIPTLVQQNLQNEPEAEQQDATDS